MVKDGLILTRTLGKKHFKGYNITTMTSLGHVTSSVTWPFDTPWLLSCKRSNTWYSAPSKTSLPQRCSGTWRAPSSVAHTCL